MIVTPQVKRSLLATAVASVAGGVTADLTESPLSVGVAVFVACTIGHLGAQRCIPA
ncbi:MAG: hypothetical protein AAF533_02360 [Acidobacteriota bacterium]